MAAASALLPLATHAQSDWPDKQPIRLIVPYSPGGSSDTLGRLIARYLEQALKQTVVVENKPGAGGVIGSQLAAKAAPDGYTLVVSGIGSHVIAPVNLPGTYDPMKDFTHIALLGGPPLAMVVNAEQPIRSVKEFIEVARTRPGGISWGSPGQGTHGHLTGELFRQVNKLNMVHISYKGSAPAVADLLANQIPAAFMTLSTANSHVATGRLRLLALTSAKRLPEYPDTPTFAELGLPQLTGTTWFSVSGPAGMPQAIVDKLNAEIRHGMHSPEVTRQLKAESMQTADYDAKEFTRFVGNEIARWTPAVQTLGHVPAK